MFKFIAFIGFVFAFALVPEIRYICFHFFGTLSYAVKDGYAYIKFKRWNEFGEFGQMNMYIADSSQPFGSGKTINVTAWAKAIYDKYNDKLVWCPKYQKWLPQKIRIISNYKLLDIPYIPLNAHQQIIECTEIEDDENVNIWLILIDEMGTQFNNRNWKDNLSEDLLSAILQQRKNKVAVLGTVQDYSLFDATLRKLCTKVYVCKKRWRFCRITTYFAKDVERADGNLNLLKSQGVRVVFATDKLYNSYDTNEKVAKLVKAIEDGDMLSNKEILEHADSKADFEAMQTVKRKFRKRVRK